MSDNSEIAERFSIHHFMRSNGIGPCKFQTGKLCAGSGNIRTCKPSRKKKRFGSRSRRYRMKPTGEPPGYIQLSGIKNISWLERGSKIPQKQTAFPYRCDFVKSNSTKED